MKEYLYETHCHTSETSHCGRKTAAEVVEHYKNLGYDGIIVTDHLTPTTASEQADLGWKAKADFFLEGYRRAKAFETDDFSVILGMELRFEANDNDYLVFGFDEDFIYNNNLQSFYSLKDFRKVAEENGLLIYQAHPFRPGMTVCNTKLIDGIEIYNGNPNHNSSNDIAGMWAKKHSLRPLSGSDYHGDERGEPGGIYLGERVTDPKRLAELLRENSYKLK